MSTHETIQQRQLESALVIGGTGFVGRHTVRDLLANGYTVTTMSRGEQPVQFTEETPVEHVTGNRSDPNDLHRAYRQSDPDLVIDCAAFYPGDVETAADVFSNVGAYVYVSSGGTYAAHDIPKREDETPLHDCTPEQAEDDSLASYGPRKAECDRETAVAAAQGVTAMSVRPTMVYGPKRVPEVDNS
jgi:nucleoside-diphosphate-sugar epimerase